RPPPAAIDRGRSELADIAHSTSADPAENAPLTRRRVSTGAISCRMITIAEFERVDVRVGRAARAGGVPEARKPAYKLLIDFGPAIGTRRSSAQLTQRYGRADLEGRLVLAVVNFPPRQIGPFMSDVLTLGVPDADGATVLVIPDRDVPLGV